MMEGTAASEKIQKQIQQIYEVLLKYGFPGLVSAKIAQSAQQIEAHLSDYFQPNIKRQNLIEWLIINCNPLYSSDLQPKNKKKIIMNHLWQLGVMPFNKHTTNLDYQKYFQGLLGHQNAVELIHSLCMLVKSINVYGKAKEDKKFKDFYEELMSSYDSLVNSDYDPYKVSFPPAYQHIPDEQFEQEFQRAISSLKEQHGNQEQADPSSSYEDIFRKYQENKGLFQQKYSKLIEKVREVITKNEVMINSCKDVQSFNGRTLNISPTLSKIYRTYKQTIKISKITAFRLKEERVRIQALIEGINDAVCL